MDLKRVCGNVKKKFSLAGQLIFANGLMAMLVACGGGGNNDNVEQFPTQPVTIDVLSALVTPSYTLDIGGGPVAFPLNEYDEGNLVLVSTTSVGDKAVLG